MSALGAFLEDGLRDVAEERVKIDGHEQFARRGVPAGTFVVREHADGFDLHLEIGDAIRTWRLRKGALDGPGRQAARHRAGAVRTADGRNRLGPRSVRVKRRS